MKLPWGLRGGRCLGGVLGHTAMGGLGIEPVREIQRNALRLGFREPATLSRTYVPHGLEDMGLPAPCLWAWPCPIRAHNPREQKTPMEGIRRA